MFFDPVQVVELKKQKGHPKISQQKAYAPFLFVVQQNPFAAIGSVNWHVFVAIQFGFSLLPARGGITNQTHLFIRSAQPLFCLCNGFFEFHPVFFRF